MNFDLLKRLCETPGIPGREEAQRAIVISELKAVVDSVSLDTMGNVTAVKAGAGAGSRKKVMIAAHMDEIGFMVKHIDDKGFLRIHPLGGFDPRQLFAQRVIVTAATGAHRGILSYSTKPAHLLTEAERSAAPKIDSFFVDLGMGGDEAKEKVRVGDMVTMDRTVERCGKNIIGKTMDDRVGVFVMIEAMKKLKKPKVDIYAVATVQEEIGLRGAVTSAYTVAPDVGIALDVTLANDYPGPTEAETVTKLGAGAAIKIMDSSLVCHPKLVEHFRELAEKNKIPHQMELLTAGGTDAGAIQRSRGGVVSITLSVPCRYVHTVNETVNEGDVQATIDLLALYLENAHKGDYSYV